MDVVRCVRQRTDACALQGYAGNYLEVEKMIFFTINMQRAVINGHRWSESADEFACCHLPDAALRRHY
jgi:hypothetical protein